MIPLKLGMSSATRKAAAVASAASTARRVQGGALLGAIAGRPAYKGSKMTSFFAGQTAGRKAAPKIIRKEQNAAARIARTQKRNAAVSAAGARGVGYMRKHPFRTVGAVGAGAGIAAMITSTGKAVDSGSYQQTRGVYGRSSGNPTGLPGGMY